MPHGEMSALVENLTATGILFVAFGLMLRWFLREVLSELKRIRLWVMAATASTIALERELLAHDLTVTDLNPSTGSKFEERDSKAFAKYTALDVALAEQERKISTAIKGLQAEIR